MAHPLARSWRTCSAEIAPGDRRHRPVGDDWNGGGQIQRNLSEISRIVQEGTQCGGHEFRSLPVQSWRLGLNRMMMLVCSFLRLLSQNGAR